jgi:hypothetical protein
MIPATLPAIPRITTEVGWTATQRSDLYAIWQDIARIFNLIKRSTGLTTTVATGTVINHNLGQVPSFVTLQPQDGTPTNYFADTYTSTSFTIHYTGGGTHAFGWSAEQ